MRYKIKWNVGGTGPLTPELCDSEESAKNRVRQSISERRAGLVVDLWNEDETWQIVTSAGVKEWCDQL